MPEINMDTAMRLAILRVALAGGMVSTSRGPGVSRVDVTLPGCMGTIASFSRDEHGKSVSQLFRAAGEALSLPMNLSDPIAFASFMHNLDCEMYQPAPGHNRRQRDEVPGFIAEWADVAYASTEPVISEVVREMVSLDSTRAAPPSTVSTVWFLPETAVPLLVACLSSKHWRLKRVASSVNLADQKGYLGASFSPDTSHINWLGQVKEWLHPDDKEEILESEGDFTWTYLPEPIDRTIASKAMRLADDTLEAMGGKGSTFWELRSPVWTVGIAVATPEGIVTKIGMVPGDDDYARWETSGEVVISMLADHCGVPNSVGLTPHSVVAL